MRKIMIPEDRWYAMRAVQYAISLATKTLHELDATSAQLATMSKDDDGRSIVCPSDCLALDTALRSAARQCREIVSVEKTNN